MANITGTTTLAANTSINLDAGTTASSGGDLLWNGTTFAPQGKAAAYDVGSSAAALFPVLTLSIVQQFSALFNGSAFQPAVNDVIGAKTNGANYAALLVTAISGTSITVQFVTFANAAPSGPTVTGVLNNYSYTPPGFPNSGIAQGSLFIITGTGLADPSKSPVLQDSSKGLPATLNGSSVKVTSGSTTVTPVFYYTSATQLALVLPSNTPVGSAQLTVTYNNQTSAPYTFQVVSTAMGFDTYSQGAVATNPVTGALYGFGNSIPPGTTVVLWGSGLGADPARDTTLVGAAFSIPALAHIYVGGVDAGVPSYQGASGYPGLNQINFTVPLNAPTGCNVSLVGVTASGVPTNFATLPIGNGACSDPGLGVGGSTLQNLSGQTTVKTGFVSIYHSVSPASSGSGTQVNDFASASFQSYTGSTYGSASGSVSIGGCIVSQLASAGGSLGSTTGLDAGTISVSNPAGTSTTLMTIPRLAGLYEAQLASGFLTNSGGMFLFKGTGGANVGAFNASVVFPTPLLTWTNQAAAATVTRSAGLPVTWSSGAAGTFVIIGGSSVAAGGAYGSFTCISPVAPGQFAVPPYVLAALPAGTGNVTVSNETNYTPFSASGIDLGLALGLVSYSSNSTFN